jgi:hypothetical protein
VGAQARGKTPGQWKDPSQIEQFLRSHFSISYSGQNQYNTYYQDPSNRNQNVIGTLYCIAQSKAYLRNHEVPRWYHATNYQNLDPIVRSGVIKVMHRQAFNGAWVSSQREPSMGDSVFCFSHRITDIDPDVFIGYEQGQLRWRGLQKAIPLEGPNAADPHLLMVGLPYNQMNQKDTVKRLLENQGFQNPFIVNNEVVDFLQKEVMAVIGNPNLSDKWWGKAKTEDLDRTL